MSSSCLRFRSQPGSHQFVQTHGDIPGATQFTLIPRSPSSRATARVNPCTAYLLAVYTGAPFKATKPAMLAKLTRLPPSCTCCNCALRQLNTPFTFTSMTKSHSSSVVSRAALFAPRTPAMFAAPSRGPSLLTVDEIQSLTSELDLTSRAWLICRSG